MPFSVSYMNKGAEDGTCELICMWLLKARSVLQEHFESVHRMSSPLGNVLVFGARKPPCLMFEDEIPSRSRAAHEACFVGSKGPSTVSSESRHCPQKATHAMAKTAASKVFVRHSARRSACRWAREAGFLFGLEEEAGEALEEPCRARCR